jgi:hypothetical protein
MSPPRSSAGAPPERVTMTVLEPGTITPLHTFTSTDADGVWNITVGSRQGTFAIPVRFVNLADHPVSLSPLAYSLEGGNVSISTQADLGDSYDQEVCAAGTSATAGVSLSLPPGMQDSGKVTLVPGSPFTLVTSGQVNESTSFWFELYHPYGLDVDGASSVVVNDLMAASSQPIALTSNSTLTATLTLNMPLREGRYDLRAYFQNSTGLDVTQSRVLIINDSWVSLSDACPTLAVQSPSISYSASLTNGLSSWPRAFYIMYRVFGVEAVTSYPVGANISSVNFVASPWDQPLEDAKVNVSPATGVLQTSQEGGSLFILASRYPVQLNYSLDIGGGGDLVQGSTMVFASYQAQTTKVSLAKLTVQVLGAQSSATTVEVSGPQGLSITRGPIGSNQTASFILPTGSYTVTASQGGNSQSAQVGLTDGLPASVDLNLSTFPALEVILVLTAIIAAIANVLVWVVRSNGLGSRMAAAPK